MYKRLTVLLTFILLALLSDRFVFTPAGYKIKLEPPVLKASVDSEAFLEIYRSNLLCFRVPFSDLEVIYHIEQGGNLIELDTISSHRYAVIRSKGFEGEAVIKIYSSKTGIELSRILIKILPKDLALQGFGCCRTEIEPVKNYFKNRKQSQRKSRLGKYS